MTIDAVTPQILTGDEVRAYVRQSGLQDGSNDALQSLLNGVHGFVYEVCQRKHLLLTSTTIVEYGDGYGVAEHQLDEWPVTEVSAITLHPHVSSLTTSVTAPGSSPSNSEVIVNQATGELRLQETVVPEGFQTILVAYKAGHAATSPEIAYLKSVMLEAFAAQWKRFITQDVGLVSRRADENEWTFQPASTVRREILAKLRPFRRLHW